MEEIKNNENYQKLIEDNSSFYSKSEKSSSLDKSINKTSDEITISSNQNKNRINENSTNIEDTKVSIEKDKNEKEEEEEIILHPKDIKFLPFSKKLSTIAFPTMIFYLFVILMQTINLVFIRIKYDSPEMGQSIGASSMYMNCTLFAILMGLISGIDTLCANAYAVKKYYLMGLYLHRARIITYSVCTFIVIIHIFTAKYAIDLFDLKESVKSDACTYLYFSLVYVFFDVQSAINIRYLNVIRRAHITFMILLVCIILHPLWNLIFVVWLDWEIKGSAIAFVCGRIILCILTTGYLWIYEPVPEASFWINKKCFLGLWDYLKFSSGAAILMCAEWWPFELLALMCNLISELDYNVHIYAAQLSSLLFSLPIGISAATTLYVSDYIAKHPVKVAKRAAYLATIFSIMCQSVLSILLFCVKGVILEMFTSDKDILRKGEPIITFLCFSVFFDNLQFTFSSILRGLGKQTQASVMTIIQFYIVMMSLAYVFGIVLEMGVNGIWLAILIGNFIASCLYLILILFIIDWDSVKEETIKRLNNDSKVVLLEE